MAGLRVTLRQLEYFVATCTAGSVTGAAEAIPVAPSSVSAALAQLEAILGADLLIRHHARGVTPTPTGRRVLARARTLLAEAAALEHAAAEPEGGLAGTLELGCFLPLAPLIAPRLCRTFEQAHPGVAVELAEGDQQALLAALRTGELALALTYDLELAPDLAFEELAALPPYAILPEGHPLAARDQLSLAELAPEPLVLLDLPYSRDYFRALFLAEGLDPVPARRSLQPDVIRSLVANGYGYSIVNVRPHVERALDGRPLREVPIAGQPRPMLLGLAHLARTRAGGIADAFAAHCRRAVAAGDVPGLGRA